MTTKKLTVKRVFIASPADLEAERKQFPYILETLNKAAHAKGIHLEPLGWKDTLPGMGRAQALINKDIEQSDVFVLLLWKRWGTPPGGKRYKSGTEEEFALARRLFRKHRRPQIFSYFRNVPQEMMADAGRDLKKVLAFRSKLEREHVLFYQAYSEPIEWERLLTKHLLQWLTAYATNPKIARKVFSFEDNNEMIPAAATRKALRPGTSVLVTSRSPQSTEAGTAQKQLRRTALELARRARSVTNSPTAAEQLYSRAVQIYADLSIVKAFGLFYLQTKSLDRAEEQFHHLLRLASQQGDMAYQESARASLDLILQTKAGTLSSNNGVEAKPRISDILDKKAAGYALTNREIHHFVSAYTASEIGDYQAAALLMAIHCRGFNDRETAALAEAMTASGEVLDLSSFQKGKVSKHSTGGVGDKTTLVVGPAAAAGGLIVPLLMGRGLGHTGGTLDKLEAIPGFNPVRGVRDAEKMLRQCGLALMGGGETVPADRRLYALRDVTGTAGSLPLISASIMCKKLAEGTDGLVLDVKVGTGAFLTEIDKARELARSMIAIGQLRTKPVHALLTRMDQPLGCAIGNALEVEEAIETLRGNGPKDLVEVCREITAHMFLVGGLDQTIEAARARFDFVCAGGQALKRLEEAVAAHGGDIRTLGARRDSPTEVIVSSSTGYISGLDARALGTAVMSMGAGRERIVDAIDPAAGVVLTRKVGDRVAAGEPVCTIYKGTLPSSRLERARELIQSAIRISDSPIRQKPIVIEVVQPRV